MTLQIASAISKMWFVSFFNIAIVVFLINAKYEKLFIPSKNSVIFAGKFKDFTSNWYGEVGAAIGLTTFISSVVPIINIAFMGIAGAKRCWDRSCTCDRTKTKKVIQKNYELLYYGPEFTIANQYSALVAMTLIVLTYSSGLPCLYLAGFLICFCSYWTSKFMFLRHYKNPPQYTKDLIMRAIYIMEYGVALHLIFGVFMLTQ